MNPLERFGALERLFPPIARVLLSGIFLLAGIGKMLAWPGLVDRLAETGFPVPVLFAVATIAVEIGGGLMLLTGWCARIGAGMLFLFLIPVTLVYHDFWNVPAQAMAMQRTQFLKNLAIMGGLLMVVATHPCSFLGIMGRFRRRKAAGVTP